MWGWAWMRSNRVRRGRVQIQCGVGLGSYASVLGTFQHTRGACASPLVVGTLLCTHGAELLPHCWAHPLRTRGAWAHPTHTWHLGTPQRTRDA